MAGTVTIIGGHGKIALIAAKLLVEKGYVVKSLIRNPEQVVDVENTGAKGVIFDLEKAFPQQYIDQFTGSDAVIWSAGAGGKGPPERTNAVDREAAIKAIKAAQSAKVPHYITVSFLYADKHPFAEHDGMKAYGDAKADADEFLKDSGLNWTIVGPGNLSIEQATGKIQLNPSPETSHRTVSRANVAKVLLEVVENPSKTTKKTIDFIDGEEEISSALNKL